MKKILFVCSGNICRSPMAEALLNDIATKESLPFCAVSAGLYTDNGRPYSTNSVIALEECGITLSGASKVITHDLVDECDYIFGLTEYMTLVLQNTFSDMKDKIFSFPVDIPDPYGGDIEIYRNARDMILCGIKEIIKSIG